MSTSVVEHVETVVLEGARYSLLDLNAMLRLLLWMQVSARGEQMTLVEALWHYNALTDSMADSIRRAAEASGMELPENYRVIVGPVARARKDNEQRRMLDSHAFAS